MMIRPPASQVEIWRSIPLARIVSPAVYIWDQAMHRSWRLIRRYDLHCQLRRN